jgi:hypothetical protein
MIDAALIRSLESKNILVRRQAIVRLGEERTEEAIRLLAKVYKTDPSPQLRELAKHTAKGVRDAMNAPPPEPEPKGPSLVLPDDPNMPVSAALMAMGGGKALHRKKWREQAEQARLAAFLLASFLIGLVLVAALLRDQIAAIFSYTSAAVGVESAAPFQADAVLDGGLYRETLADGTVVYIQEPRADVPEGGVMAMVVVRSSDVNSTLGMLAINKASEAGVLLVVPDFAAAAGTAPAAAVARVKGVVDFVKRSYTVNAAAFTLYGSGWGGDVAAGYVAAYPRDLGIASIGNAQRFQPPALNSGTRFVLMAGGQDAVRAEAALNQKQALDAARKEVLAFTIVRDAGNIELPGHVAATISAMQAQAGVLISS